MPRLGETMEEGKIVGWLIKSGDSFKRGDPIVEIETDKTIAEFPALGDGRLGEILVSIGDMIDVGKPLARIDIGDGPDWTAGEGDESETTGEAAVASTMEQREGVLVENNLEMPRLGETMEEGRIAKWLKAPGDSFVRGEAIIEIETDKTIAELPAMTDGRLVSILRDDGDIVPVGEPIARIEIPASAIGDEDRTPIQLASEAHGAPAAEVTPREIGQREGRQRATPLARRLARRERIDLSTIVGSGRRGRIEKADVLNAAAGSSPAAAGAATGEVKYAAFQRGKMAYLDLGGAGDPPVLLLHGFSGDRTTWAALASGLKRAHRRVIIPDLPGHGLTGIEADGAADLSLDLPAFLDAVGLTRVDVVAHSLGAIAALGLAEQSMGKVASITLIAPAGLGLEIDMQFVKGMAAARSGGEVAHLLRRLSVNSVHLSEEALSALASDLAKGRLVALSEAVVGPMGQKVDGLAAIEKLAATMPIRVLFGLEDRIIPWKHALGLPARVPVHFLSNSGHMPQWDQTKEVLDILLSQGDKP
ncbi:acetoin dehydrogenase dihydrolipoyllysine-residue acetyltransferase subunit [Mesorhizobium sp. M8A.F.Ca.ET.218.01.1.1]|nr:acetoin dehydrogenase dihydrolipoyllysine-residue acetyltransferase subunit [Mesorhizobium sp. M8A.F.Ca.ET.218.01.1.1]